MPTQDGGKEWDCPQCGKDSLFECACGYHAPKAGYCKDCKHWTRGKALEPVIRWLDEEIPNPDGICAKLAGDIEVEGYEWSDVKLHTKDTFGCLMFERS